MDQMLYACFSRILSGRFYNFPINIISLNIHFNIIVNQAIRLIHRLVPEFSRNQVCPLLRRERAIHPRCDIGSDHRRLNWKCPTSTEWIYKNPVFFPRCQQNQSGCQCLCNRRFAGQLTISSLMKRNSRSVDSYRHDIFH